MNSECFCISLDQVALRTALEDQLGSVDLVAMVEERCPFLFSAMPVFVSEGQRQKMEAAVHARAASFSGTTFIWSATGLA